MKKNVGISYKAFAVILAAVLVLGGTIGGTMAWLIDKPDAVENVFTESDISITLQETPDQVYKMVPGHTIDKDPKITVKANSEDCYVFVEVKESENYDNYLVYAIAEGWSELQNVSGVYYRTVEKSEAEQSFSILGSGKYTSNTEGEFTWAADQVLVKPEVTKQDMKALVDGTNNRPTLTFTAYAVQLYKTNPDPQNLDANQFDVTEAWQKAKGMENGTTTEAN